MSAGPLEELARRVPFRMLCHMSGEREHLLSYLNEPLGVGCVIVTPYQRGQPGKERRTFALNMRKAKGYPTLAALMAAEPGIALSGAGAWARDPDSLLILTPHEEPSCFTVNATLRNLPPVDDFVVEWNFPLLTAAADLDPDALRRAGGPAAAGLGGERGRERGSAVRGERYHEGAGPRVLQAGRGVSLLRAGSVSGV